ncbi:hypothetical protein ABVT39_024090 [Epinephelus coioides]
MSGSTGYTAYLHRLIQCFCHVKTSADQGPEMHQGPKSRDALINITCQALLDLTDFQELIKVWEDNSICQIF